MEPGQCQPPTVSELEQAGDRQEQGPTWPVKASGIHNNVCSKTQGANNRAGPCLHLKRDRRVSWCESHVTFLLILDIKLRTLLSYARLPHYLFFMASGHSRLIRDLAVT